MTTGTGAGWSDASTFTVWDPPSGLFLLARLAVLPHVPASTAGVLAWHGARPDYAYGHAVDGAPSGDGLVVAGLGVTELAPGRGWQVALADGDNLLSLQWEGTSGVVDYDVPVAFGDGHEEQACRVTGEVTLNGRTVRVDQGVGQRERTWGVRDVAALAAGDGWCAVTGFLGRGDDFGERTVDVLDLGATAVGFVRDGTDDLRVTEVDGTREHDADGSPQSMHVVVTVEDGRRFTVDGSGHGQAVVVPNGAHTVHQRLMTFRTDDGLEGYGICEALRP